MKWWRILLGFAGLSFLLAPLLQEEGRRSHALHFGLLLLALLLALLLCVCMRRHHPQPGHGFAFVLVVVVLETLGPLSRSKSVMKRMKQAELAGNINPRTPLPLQPTLTNVPPAPRHHTGRIPRPQLASLSGRLQGVPSLCCPVASSLPLLPLPVFHIASIIQGGRLAS